MTWQGWSLGHEIPEPVWSELTSSATLNVLVGLEDGLWRRSGALHGDLPDQSALRLLDALAQTGVQLVVSTSLSRLAVDVFRVNVPGVLWCAERGRWVHDGAWTETSGDPSVSLGRLIDDAPSVAIGGSIPLARFAMLAPYEVGYIRGLGAEECVRRVLPGPSAVRAFLWWLTQERDAYRRSSQVGATLRGAQLPR
jgi:hypothetical protein